MSKVAKVRALLAQATTEGERAACEAALARLLREEVAGVAEAGFEEELAEAIAAREVLDGVLVRVARRLGSEALVAALEDYRWNPSDDSFRPAPRLLE